MAREILPLSCHGFSDTVDNPAGDLADWALRTRYSRMTERPITETQHRHRGATVDGGINFWEDGSGEQRRWFGRPSAHRLG